MDKSITIEDRERKDYEKEIVNLRLHEEAVIPREHFPYALFLTYEANYHYYGRVFVQNEVKQTIDSLYFQLTQEEDNIRVRRVAEREYLEALSNAMMRR